jgi:hypothetical protein
MIVEPNERQHPDIQKLKLNVQKLEEITIEALSGFFADKDNPANAKKRPFLNEIFKVAKQEERFKKEEIGKHRLASARFNTNAAKMEVPKSL